MNKTLLTVLLCLIGLVGCGQKGELYVPPEPSQVDYEQ